MASMQLDYRSIPISQPFRHSCSHCANSNVDLPWKGAAPNPPFPPNFHSLHFIISFYLYLRGSPHSLLWECGDPTAQRHVRQHGKHGTCSRKMWSKLLKSLPRQLTPPTCLGSTYPQGNAIKPREQIPPGPEHHPINWGGASEDPYHLAVG
uniref:Uncharacterized protein n=1 Tax=Qingyuan Parti tick virus 1 TaxID=2972280 RepID=A0A9E7V284_9VIRU|nr:MAG: hypothetical protein [Qingyuan Parti tick virus 1]